MASQAPHIAIVGGGLCGLALAIALTKRSVPCHIYESRSSFTEIGAGINIGPNTLKAFECIDPSLGDAVYKLCSRNPVPKETVWMQLRYGAPTAQHKDYDLITELMAPPTGNMAAHRNDLLQMLADHLPPGHASFNKKVVGIDQAGSYATLQFADGTTANASIVVACDGIHSAVRKSILDKDDPAAVPQFVHDGAYRAMIPVKKMQSILGEESGRVSQIILGPDGYIVMYTIAGGENVNLGIWLRVKDKWTQASWVKEHQRDAMLNDCREWGEKVHQIMDEIPDPAFWATHCHSSQPKHAFVGRVCLIGDSAHSMPPHQGAGSGQAMEDAYVLAELLAELDIRTATTSSIRSAFEAFDEVRRPHSQQVLETSIEAMQFWSDFYEQSKSEQVSSEYVRAANERMAPIWTHDLKKEARLVCEGYRSRLDSKA